MGWSSPPWSLIKNVTEKEVMVKKTVKRRLTRLYKSLDPVALVKEIRRLQKQIRDR